MARTIIPRFQASDEWLEQIRDASYTGWLAIERELSRSLQQATNMDSASKQLAPLLRAIAVIPADTELGKPRRLKGHGQRDRFELSCSPEAAQRLLNLHTPRGDMDCVFHILPARAPG